MISESYLLYFNIITKKGTTIKSNRKLIEFAEEGSLAGVQECLKNGADVNIKNYNEMTVLDLARENDHNDIVKHLQSKGAKY